MNCKKVRESIQLEYMDGEAPAAISEEIKRHLKDCAECRAFQHMVKETVSEPFKKAGLLQPPERVWLGIKEAIEHAGIADRETVLQRLTRWLRAHASINRPVFALSSAITLMLALFIYSQLPFHKESAVKNYLQEQTRFLSSLQGPVNGDLEQETTFGTSIEGLLF